MTPKETPTLDISGVLPPECLYARGRFAFELQAMPPEGRLRIAARQWGRVWLNGVPLGRIFVRHHEDEWRYHEFDLLPHLRVGRNVVGVLLHSVGSPGIHIPGTQPRQPILMRASSGTRDPSPRRGDVLPGACAPSGPRHGAVALGARRGEHMSMNRSTMKHVKVAADRWNFETSDGAFITPLGGNMLNDQHPGQGTLFDNFDQADCDRRFGLMAEVGLNCVRQAIGVNRVFDPATGLKAAGMKNWDTFIGLAEKHGVYLMPVGGYIGGNDWFDVERLADSGRQLDWDCAFWEAFAGHYKDHPAIWAWDLRNELLYWTRAHMVAPGSTEELKVEAMLKDKWPWWLEIRYGTVAAMNKVYGAAYSSFAEVPGSIGFTEKPFDPCAFDFRNYLNDRGYDWCKRQCDAIRAAAPGHMICQGNNAWLAPDQDLWLANGFHNRSNHALFDFVTFHPYPAWECVPGGRGDPLDGGEPLKHWLSCCIGNARMDNYGKPVVVQEFGWYGGGESRFLCDLPYRSEQEHADYTRTLTDALIPHVNGFVNWPTFDMPAANDISNHGGIFTHDGKPKVLAKVYADLVGRLNGKRQVRTRATTTLTYSLLGLYTCRGYQDRMWADVHANISAGETPEIRFV